jgi:hypothetical protein
MTNLAACAVMFLHGHVQRAIETIPRSYSLRQVRQSIRRPSSERPYFTPGFSHSLPLRHTTRIVNFENDQVKQYPKVSIESPIVSDTSELKWYHSEQGKGLVIVETEKSQALIGFIKNNNITLKNLSTDVENKFCSIILTSLDAQTIPKSQSLLLVTTARSANKGMIWNEDRTSLSNWGSAPTVIEPVKGRIFLRNIELLQQIEVIPLDGAGKALGDLIYSENTKRGHILHVGEPATTWYLIKIKR